MDEKRPIDALYQERVEGSWLVLSYPTNPIIRLDARMLDRILVEDGTVILAVADMAVAIPIAGEYCDPTIIVERLLPYTRSAPIAGVDSCEYAKQRLRAAMDRERYQMEPALFLGDDPVLVSDEFLYVGDFVCRISDVERYASVAASIPIRTGAMQAALAMLIIASARRTEDTTTLSRKIADYESSLGRAT